MVKSKKKNINKRSKLNHSNKRLKRKTSKKGLKQRGGNPKMIKNLCNSSKRGDTVRKQDSVTANAINELCNSSDQQSSTNIESQSGGMITGIMSKIFKAATFPVSIATGTFRRSCKK